MKSQPTKKLSTESEQPKKTSIKQSNSSELPRQSQTSCAPSPPTQESQLADNNG